MEKSEKLEQRCVDIGRRFFAFFHKKASVPSGCVPAGIRYVTYLAGMNNYLTRYLSCGLHCGNSNATVTYYGKSV